MKNMKKLFAIVFTTLISSNISACNNSQNTMILPEIVQTQSNNQDITTRAKLDNPPIIAQGAELSVVALMDDGKIIKYQTVKSGKAPTTIVYQSKWTVLDTHPTTSSEANTILKLLSQNGYAKEYATMSQRYDEAGLTRKETKK